MIKTRNKYHTLLKVNIILFGLFPLIPNNFKGLPVITLAISALFIFFSTRKKSITIKPLLINSSLYLIYFVSLLYTKNVYAGLSGLETSLSLIVFPIIFFLLLNESIKITIKDVLYFFIIFWLSTFLFIVINIIHIFSFNNPLITTNFFRWAMNELPIIGEHSIYASIFIGLSLIFSLLKIKYFLRVVKLIPFLIINLVLIFFLISISSKTVMISLLTLSFILIITRFNLKFRGTIILITSSFFLLYLVYQIPFVRDRFKEIFAKETYEIVNQNNSTSMRLGIWETAIKSIMEAPVLGYGIGDSKEELRDGYEDKSAILLEGNYNSHNQFLSVWLNTGVIGFMIFCYFLYYNLNISRIKKDKLFLFIIIFYMINFLTENLLERRSGVILFAFIINLIGFINLTEERNIKM